MADTNNTKKKDWREFNLTTLSLKNRNTVFLLTFVIILFGIISYKSLPKELFPEVVIPTILVQTTYPGNSPIDIENLVTRPLEKEIEGIAGIKELSSTSAQDASMIFVEFTTDVEIENALQDVKDAVDKAKSELPDDLPFDPLVMDIDLSEFPILNINLSGDYSIEELNDYAEYLEEEIESVYEISKVEIKGINDREIKINVDLPKLEAYELTFDDIEFAISSENVSMSGGEIKLGGTRRSIRIVGEFENTREIENIIVKNDDDHIVYLRDVADVINGYADPTSFARLDREPVVSVQVIKKSGENLLAATDQIFSILDEAIETHQLPESLTVTLTNDQSDMIRKQLSNLENSMIMGVIFVVLVLFYFLGTRNALFVGIAIPLSMFLSFLIFSLIGYKINMIVLFSLILALGMLVDNAIVVVENIYRFVDQGYKPLTAARYAVGEIAMPIISSTATTLAAFLPLAFWEGITGEFMKNLPITLIIVLSSSLFVALVIIPVISATFIRSSKENNSRKPNKPRGYKIAAVLLLLSVPFYIFGVFTLANLLVLFALIGIFNLAFFHKAQGWFQDVFLVKLEYWYLKIITFSLRGKNPLYFFLGTGLLLILTIGFFFGTNPKINFFPVNNPSYINVVTELPIGTDIEATDEFLVKLEDDIFVMLEPYQDIVKSVLTTVGTGSSDEMVSQGGSPNKALTTISFVDYEFRKNFNTAEIMREISEKLIGRYPGVTFEIEKDDMGPPAGKAISLEVSGPEFESLIGLADSIAKAVENTGIEGIEGLQMDLDVGKPELIVNIDRDKARRFGLSTMQIAGAIRTSLFGKDISDFKEEEDEYPIQLRLKDQYRYNIASLVNQKVSFREDGRLIQIPISAVAELKYGTTYGSVRRKDMDRVITLSSNVVEGYNATEINNEIREVIRDFEMPPAYNYQFTGEQQEQQESMAFLERAMLIALSLILLILVSQFNSLVRPLIIITSVLFSTIGVFGGLATFQMDFIVVMTGIGIISLAGIVVNNAIVLIDYTELLKKDRRKELGLEEDAYLPAGDATECIIKAGQTRLRPVLLTAITTVLGLIPLAIGLNIDFEGMLSSFNPNIYFGGDQTLFWGPISWTVIFGLSFSTFLTLIIVPVMYRLTVVIQKKTTRWFGDKNRLRAANGKA